MLIEHTAQGFARELQRKLATTTFGSRYMLGIVGYPAAGKSTVAQAIVEEFNGLIGADMAAVVPMDGYHLSNEKLKELEMLELKGIPQTFDADGFVSLLERLRTNSGTIYCPKFDRSIEASIKNGIEILPRHRLVIVEGNYLLLNDPPWNRVRGLLDEVWFIDTTMKVIFDRLIQRHMSGGRTAQGAREKVTSTDMPNAHLVDATKIFADKLIALKLDPEPA